MLAIVLLSPAIDSAVRVVHGLPHGGFSERGSVLQPWSVPRLRSRIVFGVSWISDKQLFGGQSLGQSFGTKPIDQEGSNHQ